MATAPDSANSDKEEGEIIDEFEDISDNSITLSGKCVSSKDHLPVISLSSVSEDEEFQDEFKKHHHHHHFHHHHHHHRGKKFKKRKMKMMKMRKKKWHHRRCSVSHSSDTSDEYRKLDSKLLKAAIRVNEQNSLKNSLQSRLKAMTKLNEDPVIVIQDEELKTTDDQKGNQNSSDEDDELINLRLEALRTAVLNKYQHRRKRKINEIHDSDQSEISTVSIRTDDKENAETPDSTIDTNMTKKPCLEVPLENKIQDENNSIPDEDEDVLRALLLASMSKKITKEPLKDIESITVSKMTTPLSNNNNSNTNKSKKVAKGADLKVVNSNRTVSKKVFNKVNSHNKLVRNNSPSMQHTKVQPIIININNDSDTEDESKKISKDEPKKLTVIESTVEKFLKEQRAKVESLQTDKKQLNKSNIFEKSAMKLLPKFKQVEYHNLLQKLKEKNAAKIKRQMLINSRRYVKNKPNTDMTLSEKIEIVEIKNDARALQKAIREMQKSENGRLQMQPQYTVLTPIVRKINETSADRKKYDKEHKRLLEELAEAKKKLKETHLKFKLYVRELIAKKEEIDKSSSEKQKTTKQIPLMTSTPVRTKINVVPVVPFDDSGNNKSSVHSSPKITPKSVVINGTKEELKLDDSDTSINLGDPNDIDKIYKSSDKASFAEYISPLYCSKRANIDDPFSIMCPYEIGGKCKDPECNYKHYRA